MKKKTFVKNAAILTITSLILRTIGIFFRVYLSNKIGPEGMGLYQLVFTIYVLAAVFATSGISTAVTRLVTDELVRGSNKSVIKILHRAILLTTFVATISMLLVFFGANFIAETFLKDIRATLALKVLAPSLPFMGISSCIKGYFLARRKVSYQSRAQIFEQIVRIIIVVYLIGAFSHKGLPYVCAAILIGDAIAESASCIILYICYRRDRRLLPTHALSAHPPYPILRKILSIALPISGGRYLNTMLRTIENLLVPSSLAKYSSSKEKSLAQFGMLKGMAMPILFFPASFLTSMSTLLIPEISEAKARNQNLKVETATCRTMHITLISSIILAVIFLLFGPDICQIIYGSREVGFIIRALAPIIPFMYLESVADGILKGLNQQLYSFWHSIIDSGLRIILIFFIVPVKGMYGFLFIMIVSNILTSVLNVRRLLKVTNIKLQLSKWIIKPTVSACCAATGSVAFIRYVLHISNIIPFVILSILFSVVSYVSLLLISGAVTRDDIKTLKK